MTCPQDNTICRLVSGELPVDQQREFQEHLETCPTCRSALADSRAMWSALGNWRIDASGIDLTEPVLAGVRIADEAADRPCGWPHRWSLPIRAVASVAVAVGLGIAAGHLVAGGRSTVTTEPVAVLDGMHDVVAWIGSASESATGLPISLERDENTDQGEAP